MKKFILFFALFVACISFAQAQNYTGSYTGTMDEIRMNDKTYDSQTGKTFTLSASKLTGTVNKIGSMPGTITIDLDISVDSNGNITAVNETKCGELKVLGLIPIALKLSNLSNASVKDGTLEYTLECTGTYLGKSYSAHIHFSGTK